MVFYFETVSKIYLRSLKVKNQGFEKYKMDLSHHTFGSLGKFLYSD